MHRKRENAAPGSAEQLERFKETARVLGCDEDDAAFDEKLKKLVPPRAKGTQKKDKAGED